MSIETEAATTADNEWVVNATSVESAASVDRIALNDEFVRLPADVAYATGRYAFALREFLTLENHRKRLYARKYITAREGGGKLTEAMVDAQVVDSDDYAEAKLSEITAEAELAKWRGVCTALQAKKDALVSLGAQLRAEMAGDPSMREEARNAHSR